MVHNDDPISVLSEDQSWERLSEVRVGRLVTLVSGVMDITPINFVVDQHSIVFRTAPGDKLAKLVISGSVLFEADRIETDGAWSVVVHGQAQALETESELLAAQQLELRTFVPTVKTVFVRINAESISGREFQFGPEPQLADQQDG